VPTGFVSDDDDDDVNSPQVIQPKKSKPKGKPMSKPKPKPSPEKKPSPPTVPITEPATATTTVPVSENVALTKQEQEQLGHSQNSKLASMLVYAVAAVAMACGVMLAVAMRPPASSVVQFEPLPVYSEQRHITL
jgi:outer membrane biosynthesis protein TonB